MYTIMIPHNIYSNIASYIDNKSEYLYIDLLKTPWVFDEKKMI